MNKILLQKISDSLKKNSSTSERFDFLKYSYNYYSNLGDTLTQSLSLNYLANFYNYYGQYGRADSTFQYGINLIKSFENVRGKSNETRNLLYLCYLNKGNIFLNIEVFEKAIKYYKSALHEIQTKEVSNGEDSIKMSKIYNNLGIVYTTIKNQHLGIFYFKSALKINENYNDKERIATVYSNLSEIHRMNKHYDSALYYQNFSHQIYLELGFDEDIAHSFDQLAKIQFDLNEINKALSLALQSVSKRDTSDYTNLLMGTYDLIANCYNQLKDYKNESRYLRLVNRVWYELESRSQVSKVKESALHNEFLTIHLTDSIKAAEEIELRDVTIKSEKQQRYFLVIILILSIVALILIYSRFNITKKQNRIIEEQKFLVEEKNREVTDSIIYAKRLQDAILPSKKNIQQYLKDYLIVYKPKDIISGDFYFLEKKEDVLYLAAADCTGHGVPGAMLTVACHNALQRAIFENNIKTTGEILDTVKNMIVENFENSESEIKDGMDISLLKIDLSNQEIQWSGANNRLIYFENNELKEIKADRYSIGKSDIQFTFTTHLLNYKPFNTYYLITDGFLDQFGGKKNKKFTINRLRELLINNYPKSMFDQERVLDAEFLKWKGEMDQTDDVTIFGIRI